MAVREGVRRIVRVISVLAWISFAGGILLGAVVLFGREPSMVWAVGIFGVVAFALLQGIAWIIAGFSGNEKENDGLVRWADIWRWRRSKKASHGTIDPGPTGVGGWLYLLIFGLVIGAPIQTIGGTIKNLDIAEMAYPQLLNLAAWHNYKIVIWCAVGAATFVSVIAGYRLSKYLEQASVIFALFALWVRGPFVILADATASSAYLNLPIGQYFIDEKALSNLVVSITTAIVWTLYLKTSRRVRNTYYRRLVPATPTAPPSPPERQEPTL